MEDAVSAIPPLPGETANSLADFAAIVGQDAAMPAGPADAVAGVPARSVVEPGSVEEVSALLRYAHHHGLAVIPRGLGSKLGWGNPPKQVSLVLSLQRMNRLLEHADGDLVATVQAGARLRDVQSELATAGQWLAIDPPEDGTLGGTVAADAWGPGRLRYGTMRDLLIGVTYVLADGTVARAGGKVVKNVAGYDLCKLFTGSLGTLGVLVECTVRLHPLPSARRLLTLSAPHLSVSGSMQVLRGSPVVPSGAIFRYDPEGVSLAVLFEGTAAGVAAQTETAERLLSGFGDVQITDDPAAIGAWRLSPPPERDASARLAITSTYTAFPRVIELVQSGELPGLDLRLHGYAAPPVTYVDWSGEPRAVIDAVAALRQALRGLDANTVVQHRSPSLWGTVDAWDSPRDALPLMRRVKERFDPRGILNPGRFVGGI